jgi:hypothetical protein
MIAVSDLDNKRTSEMPRIVRKVRRNVQDNSIAAQLRSVATLSTTTTDLDINNEIGLLPPPPEVLS